MRLADIPKVAFLLGTLAVLAISVWLAPNPDGRGTEPQLFAPCPIGTGGPIRCPTCGMTSGFAALVRGRPIEAARRNLMVPFLALVLCAWSWLFSRSLLSRRTVLETPGGIWMVERLPWLPIALALLYLVMQLTGL